MLLTDVEKWHELSFNLCQFFSIFSIGVFEMLELACGVHVITWIDTHFFGMKGSLISNVGIEMHVGNEWHMATTSTETFADGLEVLCLLYSLRGEAHVFTTSLHNAKCLRDAGIGVHRGSVGHGLHTNGVSASKRGAPYMNFVGGTTLVVEKRIPIARTKKRGIGHRNLVGFIFVMDFRQVGICLLYLGTKSIFVIGEFCG